MGLEKSVLKKVVVIGAAAAVALAAVVGCDSDSKQAESGSAAESSASDEDQIRELIDEIEGAFQEYDFDAVADLTCEKYQQEVRDQADEVTPPLSEFGTEAELTSKTESELASEIEDQFPGASAASIDKLAEALVAYDESAYEDAWLELLRDNTELTVDKVENIEVDGDKATADITTTTTFGDEEPEADTTESNEFAKEDGKWKDCDDPSDDS